MALLDVIIRGIDESVYRRLKAEAALRGCTISRAIEEAVKLWLGSEVKTIYDEMDANNEEYIKMRNELLRNHLGKYAIFHRGRFIGVSDTLNEAGKKALRAGAEKALIIRVGREKPAGGEWLWSSLEL